MIVICRFYRCVSLFVASYRILNTVYRGHVTTDITHLSNALKIIMHSNYLYTRDHPQRTHEDMDPLLDELDLTDAPPAAAAIDDIDAFEVGQKVQVWKARTWWYGKVTYKSRAGSLSVRFVGARNAETGIMPSMVRAVVEE
jgi:hypothetical protein